DAAEVNVEDEDDNKVSAALTPPSPTQAPSPTPQEHIPLPPQAQPAPPSSPPQQQPTQPANTSESSINLLNTLIETSGQEVGEEEEIQVIRVKKVKEGWGRIVELDAAEDVTLIDVDTAVEMDADIQGRMKEDITAVKEVNAAEPIVFDDEEVTMTMAQILIKIKAEKARILDEEMAKRLQDEEIKQAAAKEKQKQDDLERAKMQEKHLDNIKKYQSLKRKPISVAQARKNIIVYLKNMAGYKIQLFKDMTYDQVRPIFEREYNHVQTFLKSDRDEEHTKKRAAKETLL
nr:hypothetical protein [Tanacetum cinerariifolium]